MTPTHIICGKEDIAKTVLLPGDPLRAKWIAETYFSKPRQINTVRNMFGYTGTSVTVIGGGIGMPSMAVYVEELIRFYDVENIIRVGSCGSLKEDVNLGDLVIPMSASTDSNKIKLRFNPLVSYAPFPDPELYLLACNKASGQGIEYHTGSVYSTDTFYADGQWNGPDKIWQEFANYGNIVIEMESAELFTLGQEHNIQTLTLLTVSDHLVTHEKMDDKQRETGFDEMMKLAMQLY